jgi:transketolase
MEEGFRGRGGVDSMMFEFIARRHLTLPLLNLGVQGGYRFELGSREELHEKAGIGPNYIKNAVISFIQSLSI